MDIIGHLTAQQYITATIDAYLQKDRASGGFLLLDGPSDSGKYTLVQEIAHRYIQPQYHHQDIRILRDYSRELGSTHIIKIDIDEKKTDLIHKETEQKIGTDMGIRQISSRLTLAPADTCKILLIENIERMNTASANWFLKQLEEPLPGRIIIATSSNISQVMGTILSRALIIHTNPPTLTQSLEYLMSQYPQKSQAEIEQVWNFYWWRIGQVIQHLTQDDHSIIEVLDSSAPSRDRYIQYKTLANKYSIHRLIDRLLQRSHENSDYCRLLIKSKQYLAANVHPDRVLVVLCGG
jgi:DNA polymerase III delta prime subunit